MAAPRHSGMQRRVLALYRAFWRMARSKPAESRSAFEALVRQEFRRNMNVPRGNTSAIEFLLRRGERQLNMLRSADVKGLRFYDGNASKGVAASQ